MDTLSFQLREGLSAAQNSLLCCLKSRSKEERDKKEMRKCNEATLNQLFRRRVTLLDKHNPIDEDTGAPICDHWSIGSSDQYESRVRVPQFVMWFTYCYI